MAAGYKVRLYVLANKKMPAWKQSAKIDIRKDIKMKIWDSVKKNADAVFSQ